MNETFEAMHGYYVEDLEAGMSASLTKSFTEEDVAMYARVSLDDNPLHMNEAFAARTRTGGRVVHGMVTASLISAIIGTRLPGPGCLWMAQDNRFLAPVRIGEIVRATATIDEIDKARQRVRLTTICEVGEKAVLEGHALVWVPARSAVA
ncbi:MAG: MaoC family dehydratase [Gammaproteobacteria bacterium]|nr:MaoC family dehydratase [Gammaproteobacteria bacterium]